MTTIPIGRGRYQGPWLNFDAEDGIPSLRGLHIAVDDRGHLWFTTLGAGVFSYDGYALTVFDKSQGLPDNEVTSTFQDRDGSLWFTTYGGVARSTAAGYVTLTTADGLCNNSVWRLYRGPEGHLWFDTQEACYWDGERFYTPTVDGEKPFDWVCAPQGEKGELWLGTGDGLYRYDGEGYQWIAAWDGAKVYGMSRDKNGHLWFGTPKQARRYDGEKLITYGAAEGLTDSLVYSIFRDSQDDLWFTTYGEGVRRYDGERFTPFTSEDGLINDWVCGVAEDRDGHLWFTTEGGISRYSAASLAIFTTADGLADNGVMSLAYDREGRLWIGTWRGLSVYADGQIHTLDETRSMNVWDIAAAEDIYFVTLTSGIGSISGEPHVAPTSGVESISEKPSERPPWGTPLNKTMLYRICRDQNGVLWFGTSYLGVGRYDGHELVFYGVEQGLPNNIVRALCPAPQGRLWVGTYGGGLACLDGADFTVYTAQDGLPGDEILALYQDRRGRLWIGTLNGLCCFDGDQFTTFTTQDGLSGNAILSLYEDHRGLLWIGTHGCGLCRYDGRLFQPLSRRHGLPNSTVQKVCEAGDGAFWIATEAGLVCYRPSTSPPQVVITQVLADRTYEPQSGLLLPDNHKLIRLSFTGTSYITHGGDMAYLCRLEGPRSEQQVVRQGQIEWQDLPLGRYNFSVQAVDQDLNYSEAAQLAFEIIPDPLVTSLAQALSEGQNDSFISHSPAMAQVQLAMAEVAPTDVTVLITGETGVGKGLAARNLHGMSGRGDNPFIQVNCGALPEGLIESELFGHERGAFTGAISRKIGKVELAAGGTLFLDEIGDLSLQAQVKILHLLQDRTFERVGGTQVHTAAVRLVAATNRELEQMVAANRFRQDLYFRLKVFPLALPALRQRPEDIPLLATYFMEQMATHLNKAIRGFSPAALEALQAYTWPGNVRELEHVVQRAIIVCQSSTVQVGDLLLGFDSMPSQTTTAEVLPLDEYERRYIAQVLARAGSIRKAAKLLGLPTSTLQSKMKKLAIKISP